MELLSSRTAVPGLQGGVEGACNGEKGGEARMWDKESGGDGTKY